VRLIWRSSAHYESSSLGLLLDDLRLGLGHHVHLLCRLHLLSHQEVVHLLNILVQEVGVLHQSLEVRDTVQQASSNLSGHITMEVMDREVDGVTDKLQLLATVSKSIELRKVYIRETKFPYGSVLLNRWLRHNHVLLLRVEFVILLRRREIVDRVDRGSMVRGHLLTLSAGWALGSATLVGTSPV